MSDLAQYADPVCAGCNGNGYIRDYGGECGCIARCEDCGAAFEWPRDEEKPPRLCGNCEEGHL